MLFTLERGFNSHINMSLAGAAALTAIAPDVLCGRQGKFARSLSFIN